MYINNLYRFMILMGLTLPIPLGILTPPVFAETGNLAQSTVGANILYSFPNEGITYLINSSFNYKGRIFQPNEINIVTSAIGKQVTVTIANGIDTATTFTLLLPNKPSQNNSQITAVGIINNFVAPQTNNNTYTLLNGTASTGNPGTN